MSFLKQLLTPFVEFDADNKQGQQNAPATPPQVTPQQKPKPTAAPPTQPPKQQQQPQPAKPVTPVQKAQAQAPPAQPAPPPPPATGPAHHPLIDSPGKDPLTQVPVFSPSGTLVEPLPEHVQYFEKLIDNANRTNQLFQGTDFKEFVDSKIDIDDITDEALKYRTAFNVLKSTGLTREKLMETGQEYLNIVGRDLNAFQGAHSLKYRKEVGQKEALIQKKAEELQTLAQRMAALKAEINALTQEINVTKESLSTVKASFLLAGEKKQVEIETELQKIAQYF